MKCKKILTALLAAACTMSGCHGDLDIMQDNKLSASNMWIDESDAETATYGIYLYMRDALKSVHDIYLCWGEFRNGLGRGHEQNAVGRGPDAGAHQHHVFEQRLCRLERHV